MIYKSPVKFVIILISCMLLFSCNEDDGTGPCMAPIADYPFPAGASTWLLTPIKIGDTMKFKMYYRANRNSNYVYRRSENFVNKDTMLKKIQVMNTYTSFNCNDYMTVHYMVANIIGPETLSCQLTDQNDFEVGLRGTAFNKGAAAYQSHQNEWLDSMNIGEKEYYSITYTRGVIPGTGYYTDSTYMFYNQQYGFLKFIVNDTLIYFRSLH